MTMVDNNKELHFDAGLSNVGNASHVCAALQAILHIPIVLKMIEDDAGHRKKCRSMLKCMHCALYRLVSSMRNSGMGNASHFIVQWTGMSAAMSASSQGSPYEVFFTFLNKLHLEFLRRNPEFTLEEHCYCSSPIGNYFEGEKIVKVHCDLCGDSTESSRFMSVEMSDEISEDGLMLYFQEQQTGICRLCKKSDEKSETTNVKLPIFLIVHSKRPCSAPFKIIMRINIYNTKMQFKSCIVQHEEKVSFISLCPDGSVRQFQDDKISRLSLGTLVTSETIFHKCTLTVIYEKVKEPPAQMNQTKAPIVRKFQHKVIGFPNLECDLYSDLPESPKTRSISTQTETIALVDTCSRTPNFGPKGNQPFISYESCKHHKKFQFFTGLSAADFEAFHELLGGEDMICHLKLNHNLSTPERILKSCLSSKDRLMMFLLRLRRGLPLEELSFIFNISESYVEEICYAMTRLLYDVFKSMEDKVFLSAAEQAKNMPKVMKPFKKLRVILDGASFFIGSPTNFQMQGNSFSEYKSHTVLLFIIGVSCKGSTIFCSNSFEGNMSDKNAPLKSPEFLNKLEKGDSIIVDRGFDDTAELLQMGVHVIKPPPKGDAGHLNESQELTKAVAAARIYVEHAIADIKENRLLQGVIPLSLLPVVPQLVYIAAFMRNFSTYKIGNRKEQIL